MGRALFVSLNITYPEIAHRERSSVALRDCTCVAWNVGPRADGVEYIFGVYGGRVVSAYKITHPLADWPVIPRGAVGEGRRCVPVEMVSTEDWETAREWTVQMYGAVRYGDLLGVPGRLSLCPFEVSASKEELEPDV